jgi:uncharacterized OB-fold protein
MQYHLCHVAQAVLLVREPDNPRDPNAIVAMAEITDGRVLDLGYVPRNVATLLSKDIDAGKSFRAEIVEIRPDTSDAYKNVVVLAITGPEEVPEFEQTIFKSKAPMKPANYCGKCGATIDYQNSYCNSCGSALTINSEKSNNDALVSPVPENVPQGKISGVSGWLKFFCITRGVLERVS